jgi:hypothetical protein
LVIGVVTRKIATSVAFQGDDGQAGARHTAQGLAEPYQIEDNAKVTLLTPSTNVCSNLYGDSKNLLCARPPADLYWPPEGRCNEWEY